MEREDVTDVLGVMEVEGVCVFDAEEVTDTLLEGEGVMESEPDSEGL